MTYLLRQLETAWKLASYHLDGLTTEECLWRPAGTGPHVHRTAAGTWCADWPEHEGYEIGPASIAWMTWHVGFWWSMVLDHSFGSGTLTRERIAWPGDANSVRDWLNGLHQRWRSSLALLGDADLASPRCTHWPFTDRPFGDIAAWVNLELAKNAAEIGYVRFLYAIRGQREVM
jgi:hypothetical protein